MARVDGRRCGCGRGQALIRLAQAYPNGRYVGYDIHPESIAAARASANAAGGAGIVRFECRDVSAGIPGDYDVITTFDVIHDAVDPSGMLRTIRHALRPGGRYVCLDINASHRLEDNTGPLAAYLLRGQRAVLPDRIAGAERDRTGHVRLQMRRPRAGCADAGFGTVRRVEVDNPFNILYNHPPERDHVYV